jgi:hypothetical protein
VGKGLEQGERDRKRGGRFTENERIYFGRRKLGREYGREK